MSDVLLRLERGVGRITLNRPRALNALTLPMALAIDAALDDWERDDSVRLVLLDGAGERGLCAGGDIRALYDALLAGDVSAPRTFFHAEYRLNARIARMTKPFVALMDGIVMGGGIGLSAHGAHRVVTERSRLAMPETAIGFLPDVGGTWLLGRAPDQLGMHLALTASQIGAADAILCGLADVHVPSDALAGLAEALGRCDGVGEVRACLDAHASEPQAGLLAGARGWIASCYAGDSVEAILDALRLQQDPLARQAVEEIGRKSPTSLKVTHRALREARRLGRLEPCLEQEYRLAIGCVSLPDFREGVRAALVDKDRSPAWSPATLDAVTAELLERVFATPGDVGGDHAGGLGLLA